MKTLFNQKQYYRWQNSDSEILLWDSFARGKENKPHMDKLLAKYKSEEFIRLIKRWIGDFRHKTVLKTDLCEEAFGEDEILFSLAATDLQIFALDISEQTVKNASHKQSEGSPVRNYVTADVRNLPFKDNSLDIVLSSSTLDHFIIESDFKKSLRELERILKPAGLMVITLNNKYNLNFYLIHKLEQTLGRIRYPVQFYTLKDLRQIFREVNLSIQNEDVIVHLISPLNTILLFLRSFMNQDFVDWFAQKCVAFARWLGNRKKSKYRTGWFIALKCVK